MASEGREVSASTDNSVRERIADTTGASSATTVTCWCASPCDPDIRLRDIATRVGITERAVFGIVEDLERGGIIERVKVGRRNRYLINVDQPLRHELVADHTVGELLGLLAFSSNDDFDSLGTDPEQRLEQN